MTEKMDEIMRRLTPRPDPELVEFFRVEIRAAGGRCEPEYSDEGWLYGFTILLDGTVWLVDLSGPDGSPVYYTAEVGDDIEESFREALGDPTFVR